MKESFAFKTDCSFQNKLIEYLMKNKFFYVQEKEGQIYIWI